MSVWVLTNNFPVSYTLKQAEIVDIDWDYDNSRVLIRWFKEEVDGTRHEDQILTLTGADFLTYETNVETRVIALETGRDAVRNAGYDMLFLKGKVPAGSIQ